MDIDEMINRLSWKKIVIGIVILFIGINVIREIFIFTVFNKVSSSVDQVFATQQKDILAEKNKLDKIHDEMSKNFDETFASNSDYIDKTRREFEAIDKENEKKYESLYKK